MANPLRIMFKNVNLEIIAKILDAAARQYGCRVRYIYGENRLKFIGDKIYVRPLVEEMMASLFAEPVVAPISVKRR